MNDNQHNLDHLRERLNGASGRDYWRGLEELTQDPATRSALEEEFPRQASLLGDALDRRHFLKLMGASLGLAGLTACSAYPEDGKIVPYVKAPEEIVPGKPLFYATAMTLGGVATGLLVESHMGRPTKIEGNPDHPASLGATDAFMQASILTLYDPDRSQTSRYFGDFRPYDTFLRDLRATLEAQRASQGAGLRILTETITSPTLAGQIRRLLTDYPKAKWVQYEPVNRDNVREGARLAFGSVVETVYKFDKADVVVSFDADFLTGGPGSLRYARDLMARRRVREGRDELTRLYMFECTPTNTGTVADHRIPVRPSEVAPIANAVAVGLGVNTGKPATPPAAHADLVATIVADLQNHRGKSVVTVGEFQPPALHALAHAVNQALGNVGATVTYTDSVEVEPVNQTSALRTLVDEMNAQTVENLLILEGNPVYAAPSDVDFAGALKKVKFATHLSLYFDETSALCHWHIPATHYLEAWSDARAYDGTLSIQQPLIAPLYSDTKSPHEILAAFGYQFNQASYDIVRAHWQQNLSKLRAGVAPATAATPETAPPVADGKPQIGKNAVGLYSDFDKVWRRALHDGFLADSAFPAKSVALTANLADALKTLETTARDGGLEIALRPDSTIYDGRFANNGWLQETPKSRTRLTWDNALLLSPKTASQKNLSNQQVVTLTANGRKLENVAVWVLPGHPDGTATLHLGYGRYRAGVVGDGAGVNAYQLQTTAALWSAAGVELAKTEKTYPLACTQMHWGIVEDEAVARRDIVRHATLAEYKENRNFAKAEFDDPKTRNLTMFQPPDNYAKERYAWGMVVDMSSCTGCNACIVACTAENNIPIVGKTEVIREREMHWMRIDVYYQGDANDQNVNVHLQPVMCQHCEMAPCELVCPVAATSHSPEGINEMTYNRCVGTKYCANNCPYKVRRFNFLHYSDYDTPSLKLGRNPDVTVRSRGVMEKCTYCVQRINAARIDAEKESRLIQDGEVLTACQAVCPTEAIVFGNINDPKSLVSKLRSEPTNYGLLAELNTRPRTTYLAKVRNPNPELPSGAKRAAGHGAGHGAKHGAEH
jgi:MoCo/4Fe-4S cofactor protein with predicted Tat translocation signal